MVENCSRGLCKVVWLEFHGHKSLGRGVVFTTQTKARAGLKAESRIVARVSENHHRTETHPGTARKATTNKRRSDTSALLRWGYSHWREAHYSQMLMVGKCDGSEHDMAHNDPVDFGDKRNDRIGLMSKSVDKRSLNGRFERGDVQCMYCGMVIASFRADQHGVVSDV